MNKNLGPKILELRNNGLSYNEIVKKLNCSKGTISYYCGNNQKQKNLNRQIKNRKSNPLNVKLATFNSRSYNKIQRDIQDLRSIDKKLYKKIVKFTCSRKAGNILMFSLAELKEKIGTNPKCYLTGRDINLLDSKSYNLDHIIPVSKGGDNSLENCGLTCKQANMAKTDMTINEFYKLCEDVIKIRDSGIEPV